MELYKTISLEIFCDETRRRLFLRCLEQLSSKEFREGLLEALHCAEIHHIKQWLLDLREIGELDEEEEVWLQRYFFPNIMAKLGTGNFVAMVLSERCYNMLLNEAGKYGLQSYNEVIIIKNFCHLQDAIRWLDTKAAHAG
ncbi:hypothetical protein [Pontibacter flavimaris]|uniref:STAS/SEC14 domain-containing protein n=1 Tax=Pontibacter flavimaris TaxID=1797110 RepID=A0A1Q5PHH6_9BACT|nr:hypothetical protein [Pontibacter flavimaris]OKL41673.1 hypothetical protein A3841_11625 [Pontibacter flavimaris]